MTGSPQRFGWLVAAACVAGCHTKVAEPSELVKSIDISPPVLALQLSVHPTGKLNAAPLDAALQVVAGARVSWSSSNSSVATVSGIGLVTAVSSGSTTVTATSGKVSGHAMVTVTEPLVASVAVTLGFQAIGIGEATQASAQLKDSVGGVLNGRLVTWESSNPSLATVSPTGLVTGNALGTVTIIARSESVSGSAQLVVTGLPNLTLDNMYLTQAVQRFGGGVPLVIGGHPVLVNVFGTLSRPFALGLPVPRVRIEVFRGADLIYTDDSPLNGTAAPAVDPALPIHRVVLPPGIVQPGLGVRATINADGSPSEATLSDNTWPRSGQPQAIPVQAVPALPLHFVPIFLSTGGSTGAISTATLPDYLYATRQLHPVSSINATIGPVLSSDVSFGGGEALAWLAVLQLVDLTRVVDGSADYYIGVLRPPPGITFVQFGGYSYIPPNPQSTGPGTRSSTLVALGWFNRARQTTELVAHELAHAMGRMHAPCGGAAGPDPNYPYAGAQIGVFGHDLYSYSLNTSGLPLEYPPLTSDVMSYCLPPWISDYNYEGLLRARGGAVSLPQPSAETAARDCLIVWGSVEGDSVRLEPAFVLRTRPALPERPGPFTLEGTGVDGARVFSLSFEPARIDHAPNTRHFTFAVPLNDRERRTLARIRLRYAGRGSDQVSRGALLAAGPDTPGVTLERRAPDAVTVHWSPADFPAVLLRDPLTGQVLGLGRSGTLTLKTTRTELDAVLSDGIRSAVRRLTPRPGGLR